MVGIFYYLLVKQCLVTRRNHYIVFKTITLCFRGHMKSKKVDSVINQTIKMYLALIVIHCSASTAV